VILSFLAATVLIGSGFYFVIQAIDGPLLDQVFTGDAAISRLNEMDAYQRSAHFWGTVTLDVLYPLAYGGLFIGLLSRFGWSWRWLLILVPITGALADLAENTVQAMALSGYASEILVAKDIVTPIKFGALLLALGLSMLLCMIALVNRQLRADLVATFDGLATDETIRAVVLTGAGRAFTAGVDLKEAGETGFALGVDGGDIDIARALGDYPWPIIGAINGFAITGGFELALMCDVLLAGEGAKFADTHARVGIMPGWGLSQKLSRMIGTSRAKELSFTGNFLDAETAADWGLVNRVYPAGELVPAALKLASEMCSCDPTLLKNYKAVIDDGLAIEFGDALKMEIKRSSEHAASVTAESVEAARKQVTERGRGQN